MLAAFSGTIISLIGNFVLNKLSTLNVNVVHAMPGRVRLQSNAWKNEHVSAVLVDALQQHPLIAEAGCSPVTGSVVIHFKEARLTNTQFQDVVEASVQATRKAVVAKRSETTRLMAGTVSGVNRKIKERTNGLLDLPAVIVLVLLLQAVQSYGTNKSGAVRELMWAYRLLREEGRDHVKFA